MEGKKRTVELQVSSAQRLMPYGYLPYTGLRRSSRASGFARARDTNAGGENILNGRRIRRGLSMTGLELVTK